MPARAPARATAMPWLPVDAVVTPRRRSASDSVLILLVAPRSLNVPDGCRCSAFSSTSQPSAADRTALRSRGVTGTCGRIARCAAMIRSNSSVISILPRNGLPRNRSPRRLRWCRAARRRAIPPGRGSGPAAGEQLGQRPDAELAEDVLAVVLHGEAADAQPQRHRLATSSRPATGPAPPLPRPRSRPAQAGPGRRQAPRCLSKAAAIGAPSASRMAEVAVRRPAPRPLAVQAKLDQPGAGAEMQPDLLQPLGPADGAEAELLLRRRRAGGRPPPPATGAAGRRSLRARNARPIGRRARIGLTAWVTRR